MNAAPKRDTRPKIGEWLGEALVLFVREWVTWSLQGLLYLVLCVAPMVAVAGYSVWAVWPVLSAALSGSPDPRAPAPGQLLAVALGGVVLTLLIAAYLTAGMALTAAKQLRGEPIRVGDLFRVGGAFGPALTAWLVTAVAFCLGFALCVVPGFLVLGLLQYVHPLATERRWGLGRAIRESIRLTRPHPGLSAAWVLLIFLMINAGGIVVVGLAATFPIGILMLMVGYRDAAGLELSAAAGAAPQSPRP